VRLARFLARARSFLQQPPGGFYSGPADVRIGWRVEILALFGKLLDQSAQFSHARFSRADGEAVLAARIAAGLSCVEPILHGASEQTVRDVPQIGFVVAVRDLVAEVDGATEGLVERLGVFGLRIGRHGGGKRSGKQRR